jgi:isocitrate dehydrogenase kinase/phosphatase
MTLPADTSPALLIAHALLAGFDKHYRLFRETSSQAKARFETANWQAQQQAQRERIAFYDTRVEETTRLLESKYAASRQPLSVWAQAKLHYVSLLAHHLQPELAETFFNSVSCKILHRSFFVNNDFLFVRPAVSTDYIENDPAASQPVYRVYYPAPHIDSFAAVIATMLQDFGLRINASSPADTFFVALNRDSGLVARVFLTALARAGNHPNTDLSWRDNLQIQVHSSLFYRNKAAYVVGRLLNGDASVPFALPLLHQAENNTISNINNALTVDAALIGGAALLKIFSFARAYFMVDMAVPSATVQFLRHLMPNKPRAELYNALGLQKHGKTVFYRDVLYHLRHSHDQFRIASGIKGMVMLVFDLPSFPYVFKLIKDFYPPAKDTTREKIKEKYQLVKQHDRVGRMADTLEYSNVALPKNRFTAELIAEIRQFCPSLLEESAEASTAENSENNAGVYILKHLYIERRMVPLNLYLQTASLEMRDAAVVEYGQAIKDLVAANIFPGDMLWKNFGVTRHDKVVFYDYDEIEYLTDCVFRKVPQAHTEEQEMAAEPWYPIGKHDIFPETFGTFLLGDPAVRAVFMRHHADLLDIDFWQKHQALIRAGTMPSVFPYEQSERFGGRNWVERLSPPIAGRN